MHCLIVEDDSVSRMFLQRTLSPFGTADAVGDALSAIKAYAKAIQERQPYDLVCMDVSMQGIDGLEALERLRTIEAERGVVRHACARVFVITGMADDRVVRRALNNCDAYLLKPLSASELVKQLRRFHLVPVRASWLAEDMIHACSQDLLTLEELQCIRESIEASHHRLSRPAQMEDTSHEAEVGV